MSLNVLVTEQKYISGSRVSDISKVPCSGGVNEIDGWGRRLGKVLVSLCGLGDESGVVKESVPNASRAGMNVAQC